MGNGETRAGHQNSIARTLGLVGALTLIALGALSAWALEKRSSAEAELEMELSAGETLKQELTEARQELSRVKLKLVGLSEAPPPTVPTERLAETKASQEKLRKAHAEVQVHLQAVSPSPAQSAAVAELEKAQTHEQELSEQLELLHTDLSVAHRNEQALRESLGACESKSRYGQKAGAGSVQSQAVQAPGMERAPHIKVLKADPSHVIREVEPSNSARDTE